MKTNQENIIISEGRRPVWQTALAALFYTVALGLFLLILFLMFKSFGVKTATGCVEIFSIALTAFIFGLRFSMINNIYFDFEKRLYNIEYAVGPVRIGKWEHLPNIEYICVFRQGWSKDSDGDGMTDASGYSYDVNVWHDRSKHFTIYSSDEREPSYELAKHLAIKLDVDFLDATIPNEKKWVELD